ncbi:hypothetical protein [Nonomuraea sp. NPDC050786]|uniref:hypothetical protein n=1 Tax=Nonomuraea sp. NPDC050786 TaxID=3154840 RepID=UPI0033CD5A53
MPELRRGGFATQDAAKDELGQVRDLLALADPREPATRTQIADLIKRTLAETDTLLSVEAVHRKIKTGQHLTQVPPLPDAVRARSSPQW